MTLRIAALVFWKDVTVEIRAREVLAPMVFFAVIVVLVTSFSVVGAETASPDVAGGIVWIAVALSGALGVGRAFERERENDTFRALMLAAEPRTGIFVGKLAVIVAFMGIVELVVVPLVGLLFEAPFFEHPWRLLALLGLGTVGYAAAGALFGAGLARARTRDLLLSVLLYPIAIPILLAGSKGTAALLESPALIRTADVWIRFLFALDCVFVTLALWAFVPLSEES